MKMATKSNEGASALDGVIAQIEQFLKAKGAEGTKIWLCLSLLEESLGWLAENGLIPRLAVEVHAQTIEGWRYVHTFALGARKNEDGEESPYLKQSITEEK